MAKTSLIVRASRPQKFSTRNYTGNGLQRRNPRHEEGFMVIRKGDKQ